MKTKNTGHLIAVIILSVLLVLGLGLCVVLILQNGTERLNQTGEHRELMDLQGNNGEESWEEEIVTESLDAFQLTAGDVPVVNEAGAGGLENGAVPEPQPAEGQAAYLCDYSSQRPLTEADVAAYRAGVYEGLPTGKNVFQMIINEIYARHGYQFVNEEIQAYFDQKEWYQAIPERNADMNAVQASMSEVEKANVSFLSSYGEEE